MSVGFPEDLPAEPRERGEAQRAEDAGPVHVVEARRRVVGRGRISEYGTGSGVNSSLLLPTVTDSPDVGTFLSSYTHVSSVDMRGADVAVPRREAVEPHVRRFDHVVVDRDQPVELR